MGESLSRRSLYDLVWSEPSWTLCKRFGIFTATLICNETVWRKKKVGYGNAARNAR
jgi:hypothetical protein